MFGHSGPTADSSYLTLVRSFARMDATVHLQLRLLRERRTAFVAAEHRLLFVMRFGVHHSIAGYVALALGTVERRLGLPHRTHVHVFLHRALALERLPNTHIIIAFIIIVPPS